MKKPLVPYSAQEKGRLQEIILLSGKERTKAINAFAAASSRTVAGIKAKMYDMSGKHSPKLPRAEVPIYRPQISISLTDYNMEIKGESVLFYKK